MKNQTILPRNSMKNSLTCESWRSHRALPQHRRPNSTLSRSEPQAFSSALPWWCQRGLYCGSERSTVLVPCPWPSCWQSWTGHHQEPSQHPWWQWGWRYERHTSYGQAICCLLGLHRHPGCHPRRQVQEGPLNHQDRWVAPQSQARLLLLGQVRRHPAQPGLGQCYQNGRRPWQNWRRCRSSYDAPCPAHQTCNGCHW